MKCLDCSITDHDRPAIGTCHNCSAGVCTDHGVVQPYHLLRPGILFDQERVDPPTRRLLCHVCSIALNAATARPAPAQTRHDHRRQPVSH
ncbi:MAG TPA: DUF2180 family protein [Kineosporiaceae bacterium]|nr:DUF2180 family protein [Kineosporiaceae bacterium]